MARHRIYCWNPKLRRYTQCPHVRSASTRRREPQDTPVGVFAPYRRAQATARAHAQVERAFSNRGYQGSRYQKRTPYRQKGRGRSLRWHGPAYTPGRPLGPSRLPFRLPVFR